MNRGEALAAVTPFSMIPRGRLEAMVDLCSLAPAGCIVQCGVWRGGSAALLAWALGRELWLFDRFVGIPEPGPEDGATARAKWHEDWCRASLVDVGQALAELGIPPDRVRILGGDFAETLHRVETGPVAVLHLDCDWYESTQACLRRFLPDMAPGGLVIVDDYGRWPGCKAAVDQWQPEIHGLEGPAVWFDRWGVA